MSLSDPSDITAAVVIDLLVLLGIAAVAAAVYGTVTGIHHLQDHRARRRDTATWNASTTHHDNGWGHDDDGGASIADYHTCRHLWPDAPTWPGKEDAA